ncbi:MAG: D-sedoheptulose-7-phosphate isomerase [Candidatus Muiribacteriaceae bacterium]
MSLKNKIDELIPLLNRLSDLESEVEHVIEKMISAFDNGRKVMVFGNGGSASDAAHMAGELQGRFRFDRPGLPVLCLNTNMSTITAVSNDLGYENIFRKQVEGLAVPGDVVIGITTSGNSVNVIKALEFASDKDITTVCMTGKKDCRADEICDLKLKVPSSDTPQIQEMHIMLIHHICEQVEKRMFG